MFIIKNKKIKINSFFSWLILGNFLLLNTNNIVRAETKTSNQANADYGLPTHRRDGGSRGASNQCLANTDSTNLVALVPETTVGVNSAESPQLFFYVPQINQTKTLEFVLRNEQDELIYEAFLNTTGAGIINVEVPADIQADLLENNQNYHWYLSIICNFQQRSRDIVVEGWLRQSNLDLATKQELNTANSIEQAEFYHRQGYWYDALAILAANYQSKSEQGMIQAKWSELLSSVGLANLASEPFIDSELIESDL